MGQWAPYTVTKSDENVKDRHFLDSGENPARGVVVTYFLNEATSDIVTLSFTDSKGTILREFRSRAAEADHSNDKTEFLSTKAGWNRFVWDMRLESSVKLDADNPQFEVMPGPTVVAGDYQVNLTVGELSYTQGFKLVADLASPASVEELRAQFDLLKDIFDKYSEGTSAVNKMIRLCKQLKACEERFAKDESKSDLNARVKAVHEQVLAIEQTLLYPDLASGWPGRLNKGMQVLRKLVVLPSVISLGIFRRQTNPMKFTKNSQAKSMSKSARLTIC